MFKILTFGNVTSIEGSFQALPETHEKLRLKLNRDAVTDVIYSFSIHLITDMSRFTHTLTLGGRGVGETTSLGHT